MNTQQAIEEVGPNGSFAASPNEAMNYLGIGRAKLYELINGNELEAYLEGSARKITWRSIRARVRRQLGAEKASDPRGQRATTRRLELRAERTSASGTVNE